MNTGHVRGLSFSWAIGDAVQDADIIGKDIGSAGVRHYIFGLAQTDKAITPNTPGGKALRAAISAPSANAWNIPATSPIHRSVLEGCKIIVSFLMLLAADKRKFQSVVFLYRSFSCSRSLYHNLTNFSG